MTKTRFRTSPFRAIVAIYLGLTLLFAWMYQLPFSSVNELSFLDAWFLSASAISVTGLSTITIGSDLTLLGQFILLLEIQIGGIGIMVILGVFLMLFTQSISLSQQTLMSFDQNQTGLKSVKPLVFFIVVFTFVLETIGFLLIYPVMAQSMAPIEAAFASAFHSVASFTNAGFDLFGGSLEYYSGHTFFLGITACLIFAGAIGFPTVWELFFSKGKKKSLYTKVNLTGHITLIFIGFFVFFMQETKTALANLGTFDQLTNALFLSITSRSGGLSSLPLDHLTTSSLLFLMGLMFIGGSASSAAGGIRITTFFVLFAKLRSIIRGKEQTTLFKKGLHEEDIQKALLVFFTFFGLFLFSSLVLSAVESVPLEALLFEIMSALTTTGLSIGITADLSSFSLIWLSFLMIMGRIGMIALIFSIMKPKKAKTSFVKEHVIIG